MSDMGECGERGVMTRRAMLLTMPALAVAPRLFALQQAAPLRIRGLNQVTLAVSDLERSLDFYQAVFGMPVQARRPGTIILRIGPGPRFLALTEAGSAPPRIDHFGMAVEDFDVDRVVRALGEHGVARGSGGDGLSGGAMNVRVTSRGDTREVHVGDPDGLVFQLQDPGYCGGDGPLGDQCMAAEPAPGPGSLTPLGLSHFTINVTDPTRTNAFYQQAFGFGIQAMQAAAPVLDVGTGDHFLMFIAAGAGGARINHTCLTVEDFDVERVQRALEGHGITPREQTPGPLRHWISLRMPNRGGAPEGTPELYFSDPDGLSIQLQDPTYCGGGGYLGEIC
jgi:catechol 2,3-dioxygenase-like lactoylglutathione lyase family enzyme